MKVGFLNNQIDNRGTGNAVYDYAHYNETILGNRSFIFTLNHSLPNVDALMRYEKRFKKIYTDWDLRNRHLGLDALYHIKSGHDDGFRTPGNLPYLVHSVFELGIHGTRYATVSEWMGARFDIPFVPHIVSLPFSDGLVRRNLFPSSAIVLGRHGGSDTFDIPWAWSAINRALEKRKNLYFIFMNTNKPDIKFYDNKRVLFVAETADIESKAKFIDVCDGMIHARSRGETFGISVGEFAIHHKPVITYGLSAEQAHIRELGSKGIYYTDEESLYEILLKFEPHEVKGPYAEFTPEKIMTQFKGVFLNGLVAGSGV